MKKLLILLITSQLFSSCTKVELPQSIQEERMTEMEIIYDTAYMIVDESGELPEEIQVEEVMMSGGGAVEHHEIIVEPLPVIIEPISEEPTIKTDNIGDITYVLNDTMTVGITDVVNLTISKYVNTEDIIAAVDEFTVDNITTEEIRVSKKKWRQNLSLRKKIASK